jgi:DNA-binding transcriptional LysR family regulator
MRDNRLLEMQVFRAVVEHDGFTAAAYALESSQPFVSRTIAQLEQRLGAKLIHRSTRRRRLTADGERYLAACREILGALDDAEATFAGQSAPAGDLRVSAPLAFGTDQVLPLLPAFLIIYPKIKLHLSLSDAIVSLIEENIDVAIRMGRLRDSQLKARKLCDLRRIVVASPAYIARCGAPTTPDALKGHNCLEWHGAQEHLNRWPFQIAGERGEHVASGNFRSSNGLSLAEMCFKGVGIMRMAEHLALPAIRDGRLINLLAAFVEHDETAISAVYLPERRLSARVQVFIDFLGETLKNPSWDRLD